MKNSGYGKYLSEYYKNKVHSLLSGLNNGSAVFNEKNIHQLRVDIKKMNVVFHLFELLFPENIQANEYQAVLKPIFKNAGKLREIQVNRILIEEYKLSHGIIKQYCQFLKSKKKIAERKFKKAIKHFEVGKLRSLKIKKWSSAIDNVQITNKCQLFINMEAQAIKKLSAEKENPETIHKIRMHLKSLDAIISLLYKINSDKDLKKLSTLIKRNGTLIGTWHDNIILVNSLEKFLEVNKNDKNRLVTALIYKLKNEDQVFLGKIKRSVCLVIQAVQAVGLL